MNRTRVFGGLIALAVIATGTAYVVAGGIQKRTDDARQLKRATEDAAAWSVQVVHPKLGSPVEQIALPGNVQAYRETPIYARTSGYLTAWHYDIGAAVQQGQLLAEIEAPEVDKQLQQATAELATAEASLELAKSTAERWKTLLKTNSVSQQETDEKIANARVQKTTRDAVASNVKRLEDLKSFQRIYAPFSGVITTRNTDIGALISEGANGGGQELFRLSAIHKLRIFVDLPQAYTESARVGARAAVTLREAPDRKYTAVLVRTANAIDPRSRTLLTEFEVDNPSGALLPGSYVTVNFRLAGPVNAFTVPSTALMFRSEGLRVGVVRGNNAQLRPIALGRDFGSDVEVLSGLAKNDLVISDPPDSLLDGAKVRASAPASTTEEPVK